MRPDPQPVARCADQIEAEMQRIGLWQSEPLCPDQLEFEEAFATDTMTFAQWLQFVFLPMVRDAVATEDFPSSSEVGSQAIREFDTVPEAGELATLLGEFDALFGP